MDDLTRFVEGLVTQLGKAFFFAGFLPALVLVAVNQYVIFAPDYAGTESVLNFFPDITSPWLGLFTGEMLTTIVLALVLGLVLIALNSMIIRLFEGMLPLEKALLLPFYRSNLRKHHSLYARIDAKHAERRNLLARYEESGEFDDDANLAIAQELHRLHAEREQADPVQALPYERRRVAPTNFGNTWAVMEEYPLVRYGLDGMLFWPYVREVVGQQNSRLLEEIDSQKLIVDVFLHLALATGILVIEGLVFALLRLQWQMLVVAAIALLLFLIFYQASVGFSRALSSLVTKSYDLYRLPVLDAFGLARPADLDDEYWVWTRLSAFLRRGEVTYFDQLERSNGHGQGSA